MEKQLVGRVHRNREVAIGPQPSDSQPENSSDAREDGDYGGLAAKCERGKENRADDRKNYADRRNGIRFGGHDASE